MIMAWTKESVEATLINNNLFDEFIQKGGLLKLCVCGTHLLFFANNNDTVSVFYEYVPSNMEMTKCANEFCLHAIPFLSKRLAERSNRTLLTSYCIEPIYIDL